MNALKQLALATVGLLALALVPAGAAWAQVKVTAATPSSTYQGTVSLDVTIDGSGFNGTAKPTFLVSGTTDTGGITVRKTVVKGSKQLVATIDVADAAIVAKFDIVVALSDGRKGKGTTLFAVERKASDPCVTSAVDFPAFTYRISNNGYGDKLYVADSSGLCSRQLTTPQNVIPQPRFSYPVDGTSDRGRVVWMAGATIYALDFTVGPGNTVSVGATRTLYANTGCCSLDLGKDGRSIYFSDTDTSIATMAVDGSGSPLRIYASSDASWYLSRASVNGDGTQLFATKSGAYPSVNDGGSQLVRIDLTTTPATETLLREWLPHTGYGANPFFPAADPSSPRVAFFEYIEGTNNCTPLIVTDYDGNELYPAAFTTKRYGRFAAWVGNNVMMQRRTPMDRRGTCVTTDTLEQVDLNSNAESILITGSAPDGR